MRKHVISCATLIPILGIGLTLSCEQRAKGVKNGGPESIKTPQRADQDRAAVPSQQHTAKQSAAAVGHTGGPQKRLEADLRAGVKMQFILIPAGEFMMGDEKLADIAEPHKVAITKPFYLGKYEVTQEQWGAVMGDNPSHSKGPKHPVDSVSWEDCMVFVTRLNEKFPVAGVTFSLPTEAQWEYACRAGTTTAFSFGDDVGKLEEYAWWDKPMVTTHPVGRKKPNPWGLYDMHGNVCEWCSDWSTVDYYRKSPPEDPKGPVSGEFRALRGGSWDFDFPDLFRCGVRLNDRADRRYQFNGCRVAGVIGSHGMK